MASKAPWMLSLVVLAALSAGKILCSKPSHHPIPFNRSNFPAGFIFGAGSAAYQVKYIPKEGGFSIDNIFLKVVDNV
jgi:hypothetical protein